MDCEEKQLVYVLENILDKYNYPLSVSFLNTSFSGKKLKTLITFSFLEKFKDIFHLVVIGNDLKIWKRRSSEINFNETPAIQKDLTTILSREVEKCNKIHKMLIEAGQITVDDAIKRYSTNKYNSNLPFFVRNSHMFQLDLHDSQTYVTAISEERHAIIDMDEGQIWDLVKMNDVGHFAKICLQGLLEKFMEPINQGKLQMMFNFGYPIVDKTFLSIHNDSFEGGGEEGVCIKGRMPNKKKLISVRPATPQTSSGETPQKSLDISPFTFFNTLSSEQDTDLVDAVANELKSKLNIEKDIKFPLSRNSTIVIIGNNNATPVFLSYPKVTREDEMNSLLILKGYIEAEIEKRRK